MASLVIVGGLLLTDRILTRRNRKRALAATASSSDNATFTSNNEKSNSRHGGAPEMAQQHRASIMDEKNDVLNVGMSQHPALRRRASYDSTAETEVGEEARAVELAA